jgi:hypothetical protein
MGHDGTGALTRMTVTGLLLAGSMPLELGVEIVYLRREKFQSLHARCRGEMASASWPPRDPPLKMAGFMS